MNKKIVTIQEDIKDCGAACLSSIIKYYNGFVPMEKIKHDCCITSKGISAYNLIYAAKNYGFQSYGTKIDSQVLFSPKTSLPVIAHMSYKNGLNHFIVIYKISKTHLTVMDPAKGLIKLSTKDFLANWTNIIIVLYPLSDILKMDKLPSIYNIFLNYFKSEKKLIFRIIFISIILTICAILTSFYIKLAINTIETSYIKSFTFLFICFLFLTFLKVYLSYEKEYCENYLNKNLDVKLIFPFINHIFNLPLISLSTKTTGEIVKRINELNNIKELFTKMFLNSFIDLFVSLCAFTILYNINHNLLYFLIILLIVYIGLSLIFSKSIINNIKVNIEKETDLNSILIEYIDAIESVKNTANSPYFIVNIENKLNSFLHDTFNLNQIIIRENFLKNLVEEIGLFLITSYGFYLIINNDLSLLNLITFNSILIYFIDPIKNIINLLPKYNYIKTTFNKIAEFIALNEEEKPKMQDFKNGDIVINNLSFSYNHYLYPIKNINLKISKNAKIMLKGSSGVGKSTICKLIYRLYDYQTGEITINNCNIKDYNLFTIRNNITYLSQNEKLFTASLKDNITLQNNIDQDKLTKIIEICYLKNLVDNLPLRLETMILENGNNFSGGQLQRIKLARALLKNAKIIILDEALSEVEEKLEVKIIDNIKKYFQNVTLIYVTHKNLDKSFDKVITIGADV